MQVIMLVEPQHQPVPANIRIVQNYDEGGFFGGTSVCNSSGHTLASGEHMHLEATPEAFKDWLRAFDGIWISEGHPMMQQFKVVHVKENMDSFLDLLTNK